MARKPFKAVRLRLVVDRPRRRRSGRAFAVALVGIFLAAFTAVFFYDGGPSSAAVEAPRAAAAASTDRESARFTACNGPVRINCVVDGDTFWYAGEKIRVADINTPEVSEPQCAREAELGARATERLQELLNEGGFSLLKDPFGEDRDRYGRLLRTVTRDGTSVGAVLVREGLAEEWRGYRSGWC